MTNLPDAGCIRPTLQSLAAAAVALFPYRNPAAGPSRIALPTAFRWPRGLIRSIAC